MRTMPYPLFLKYASLILRSVRRLIGSSWCFPSTSTIKNSAFGSFIKRSISHPSMKDLLIIDAPGIVPIASSALASAADLLLEAEKCAEGANRTSLSLRCVGNCCEYRAKVLFIVAQLATPSSVSVVKPSFR